MRRLDALAKFSDDPACLTRLYLTPSHKAAAQQVAAWMEEAGMATRLAERLAAAGDLGDVVVSGSRRSGGGRRAIRE